jgi:integrase
VGRQRRVTGFLRVIERDKGDVFYAMIRTAEDHRLQRSLGLVWDKRSQPPEGYLTRAQAEARLQGILEGRDEDIPVHPVPGSGVTFARAGREWLHFVEHDRKRRSSTVRDYRRELERALIPVFGEVLLTDITTKLVDAYRVSLVMEGRLSPRTINKRLAQLHAIFKRAQKVHGLGVNPVAGADRQPQKRSGDFRVLQPSEVALLAASAANSQDAVLFTVAAFTGLRLGELRALRWRDIAWTQGFLHVRRSFTCGEEGPPKSGRVRSVPLVDQAARALDRVSRREAFVGDDDLVFINEHGKYFEESAMRRRFYKAVKAAGLAHIRFHDLRHTFGTLAVRAFPLTDVMAYLGHSNVQTTMTYVHHLPKNDAADRLTDVLDSSLRTETGCTSGAHGQPKGQDREPETMDLQGEASAGRGTRTPDTRIMIPLL